METADLTLERAAKLQRLRTDPRYAIENLYSVLDLETSRRIPFRFNEAQLKLYGEVEWFRKNNLPVRLWILKARRVGISTGVEGLIYHDTTFNDERVSIILANHSKPAKNVFKMCISFWKSTPVEWRPKLPDKYRGIPPEDGFEFERPSSALYLATARSLEQYLSFGCNNLHATEVARYPDAEEIFVSVFPTLARSVASMFFGESTPRGMGNYFHKACMDAYATRGEKKMEYGAFRLLFIAWHEMNVSFVLPFASMEERGRFERSLDSYERDLQKKYQHISLEQLKWWRHTRNGPPFKQRPELLDQEYPTTITDAFLSTGVSVFGRDEIKRLNYNTRDPIWAGDIHWGSNDRANEFETDYDLVRRPCILTKGEARAHGFAPHDAFGKYDCLKIFRIPKKGDRLSIGADVAEGNRETRDGDDSTIQVVCYHDFGPHEQIIKWQGKCNTVKFALICAALAWYCRYKTGDDSPPHLAIEWTGPGVTTNRYLDSKSLYDHTYRYRHPGVHKPQRSQHIGWESNYRYKKIAVNFLQYLVARNEVDIPDEETVIQMSSYRQFGRDDDEQWEGEGTHDDLVSALQIATACIKLGYVGSRPEDPIDYHTAAEEMEDDMDAFEPTQRRNEARSDSFEYSVPEGFEDPREDETEVVGW